MQRPDTLHQIFQRSFPAVDDDVVGERKARLARRLCRHDTLNNFPRQPAAGLHTGDLGVRVAVHHAHTVKLPVPLAGLHQKGHDEHHVTALRNPRPRLGFGTDNGMTDGFQTPARFGAAEHQVSHIRPVQRAIFGNDVRAESLADGFDGRSPGCGEIMCNDVSIDNGGTPAAQHVGNLALARPNAPCQTNLEHHPENPAQIKRYCTSVSSRITAAEGMQMKGPKASDSTLVPFSLASRATITPPSEAASNTPASGAHPAQAPTAASSFMSPP